MLYYIIAEQTQYVVHIVEILVVVNVHNASPTYMLNVMKIIHKERTKKLFIKTEIFSYIHIYIKKTYKYLAECAYEKNYSINYDDFFALVA